VSRTNKRKEQERQSGKRKEERWSKIIGSKREKGKYIKENAVKRQKIQKWEIDDGIGEQDEKQVTSENRKKMI